MYITLITNKLNQFKSYLHVNLHNSTMKFERDIAL